MAYEFRLTTQIPASPEAIYDAWLDSRGHTEMTGGEAVMSAIEGDVYTAWDGYIAGKNLELVPHRRIVQSWRTPEFAEIDPDSTIVVTLDPIDGGTQLTLEHRGVPDGQTDFEQGGWQDNYFTPMQEYFGVRDGGAAH